MKTIFLGKNCIEVQKTDSTNSYMAGLASLPAPLLGERGAKPLFEGTVVVANHQEQGRGQRGSTWEGEPGKNLTLSIFLTPTFLKPEEQFQLNKAVSLGVVEFIRHTPSLISPKGGEDRANGEYALALSPLDNRRLRAQLTGSGVAIKWPNDIYIGNKKVAGILIENSVSGNDLQHSIIGIGINVNQEIFSAQLPNPTSLKLITGKEFDLKECLEQLCSSIEKRYLQLRNSSKKIDSDYLKNLCRFEEWANYNYKGEKVKAKITGVSKIGKLILETEKGGRLECDFKEIISL